MKEKLKVDDKVKPSKKALDMDMFSRTKIKSGVVTSILYGDRIVVRRDNVNYGETYHESFWELEDK